MRRNIRILAAIVLIILIAVGAYFFIQILRATDIRSAAAKIRELTLWQIGILLMMPPLFYGALGLRWYLILRIFKTKVPLVSLVEYHIATTSITHISTYFEPLAKYLRFELIKKQKVSAGTSLLSLAMDLLAGRLTDTLIRLAFLLGGGFTALFFRNSALKLFFLVNIGLIGLYFLPFIHPQRISERLPTKWRHYPPLRNFLEDLENRRSYVANFFRSPALFVGTVSTSGLALGIAWLEFFLIAKFLGHTFGISQLVILHTIFSGSRLVPVPGGLGVVEAGLLGGLFLVGLRPAEVVGLFPAMIAIIRASEILWVIIGGLLLTRHGIPFFGVLFTNKNKKT